MKAKVLNQLTEFLDAAIAEKLGIVISTTDPDKTKRYLYKALKILKDKGFDQYDIIKVVTPPTNSDSEVWLLKAEG